MAEATIRISAPTRQSENEFADFTTYIADTIFERFKNQTFKKMNESTKEKFEDAQVGNYAKIFLKLSRGAKRSILRQFSDSRIEAAVEKMLSKVDKRNAGQIYSRLEAITGINQSVLVEREGLTPTINALRLETAQWVKRLRDNALESFTANALRAMSEGKTTQQIIDEMQLLNSNNTSNAKMVARTQVSTYNSLVTKKRAEKLGITKARWITSRDERVRESHAKLQGKEFDLDKGVTISQGGKSKTILPGTDYNCRCDYELIVDLDALNI